ncbi:MULTISPECIES: 2,4-dichlorophenol 6-monooxygenase [Burkholderiaceae]|uniref:2,4-dichlorophenol 6-monooxygenase n=31 Tax=Bacteria TaxID=2 RepID=TFDB_CUPPJ|nr:MULTISPECIES: 2,4-dichlorophenol 6-monooxygenase [Burkholderiaceae]P27138.1 RecName: Full=2,4-dichlorophenol 6-monooxygenase; AltName: Full=2,4-dichlorophenol hydroxylase; Short=2,4-DCP hydroxylase [Cupriavidus pinatubonensis JMP134]CDS81746.1 2,4-dichlorophenol 6-monooxygenase [Burkholderia sp. TGCL-27]CDS90714.1 2,4-dichlorophenol 6-monooxygenase [Cupriavidus sp. TGCL-2]CDS90788.1 2,4-dichlorophenol 6-monooxygenase [Cupriavidus sp. TGCL-3]CDS91051.1 2,4-dichlorophenol 6-monooxygenase [Ral
MALTIETDVLVVGTGPAGASAGALLARYGVRTMLINKYNWTAPTPRAHITNQRTMEILRDLGLEAEARLYAAPNDLMGENTICASLAGEEFGRIRTWGTDVRRRADYDECSPTSMCDLPQNYLEPILVKSAALDGCKVRFDTEYLGHEQDADGVSSRLRDRLNGEEFTVRSKYLIGADGANSRVVSDLDLPLEGTMGKSGSINLLFEADLDRYVAHRPSVLYWVIQPGSDIGGLGIGVVRMVRPWNKWLAIWGYDVEQGPPEISESFARRIVHNLIGDDSVPLKIEGISTWTVNDMYATRLQQGRVFCAGDAVHRHPPTNGLGSNTSIQDSFNLAWKIAMVLNGTADESLLDTYTIERAPIAKQVVCRANKSLEDFPPIAMALGLPQAKSADEMKSNMARRKEPGPEAQAQRTRLREAIAGTNYVYNAHGVEMNQRYDSPAIVADNSPDEVFRDVELYHQASTRPGAPMPHVWVYASGDGHRISTKDLCGKGNFTLFTGIGGAAWQDAAAAVSRQLGVAVTVRIIGPGQAYEDHYGDFARISEIIDTGAILVRPDFHVAYRATSLPADAAGDLVSAMRRILGRQSERSSALRVTSRAI